MSSLLTVAEVHEGDGNWTAGLTVETLTCSLYRATAGLCLPPPTGAGPSSASPAGWPLSPFATIVQMRRSMLCRASDPQTIVNRAIEVEKERAAGRALWFGTGSADLFFGGAGATTVASGATIGELLQAFYDKVIGVKPVLHLGLVAAYATPGLSDQGYFNAFPEIPVVINPGYPPNGVAVSGPIEIWFGAPEPTQNLSTANNKENTEATMLGAVAVDPCTVIVRDKLPDQVYIGALGKDASVYVVNSSANATVAWGDATGNATIPSGSNSPAVHTYATSGTFTITVTSNSGTTTSQITV